MRRVGVLLGLATAGAVFPLVGWVIVAGGQHEVVAARVWGGRASPDGARTLRLEVLAGDEGALRPIRTPLRVTSPGAREPVRATTSADGTVDVALAAGATSAPGAPLRIEGDLPRPWATEGALVVGAGARTGFPREMRGEVTGELWLRVALPRGVLASPFPGEIVVEVSRGGVVLPGAHVAAHADDADLGGGATLADRTTDARGRARFELVARAHALPLRVEADLGREHGAWDGALPVVAGAMWVDPAALAAGRLVVVSPAPRDAAYAALFSEVHGRMFGATVRLAPDGAGFFRGEIALPREALGVWDPTITVASDPAAQSASAVAWPARTPDDPFEGQVVLERDASLLDGVPAALDAEAARRRRVRDTALTALAGLALADAAAFALAWTLARRRGGPAELTAAEPSAAGDAGRLAAALGGLVAVFAALAVLVAWRCT